ncbi:MAG: hypothetical protein OEV44_12315, partial [Spirochaetota bacterium]|nr:hypothetical protein [Spirochaetota bacterium]
KVSFNFKTGLANLNAHFEAISIDIYDLDKKNQTNFKLAEDFKLGKLEVVVPARFFGIINVGIGVKGALGIKTGVDINKTDGLCLQITPYAGLDVFAFASIDIVIASGGVRATLKLVTASIPIKACAKPVLSQGKLSSIDLSTFGNIDANFLKGSIEIYYVIDVLFYHKEGSVELWSSKGIPLKQEIYKATKRINVKSDSTTAPRYKPMLKVPLYKK